MSLNNNTPQYYNKVICAGYITLAIVLLMPIVIIYACIFFNIYVIIISAILGIISLIFGLNLDKKFGLSKNFVSTQIYQIRLKQSDFKNEIDMFLNRKGKVVFQIPSKFQCDFKCAIYKKTKKEIFIFCDEINEEIYKKARKYCRKTIHKAFNEEQEISYFGSSKYSYTFVFVVNKSSDFFEKLVSRNAEEGMSRMEWYMIVCINISEMQLYTPFHFGVGKHFLYLREKNKILDAFNSFLIY